MTDKSIPLDGAPARVRHPAFASIPYRLFWSARLAAGLAIQMQAVVVGWHIYALTGSALNLGMVGLTQFLPSIGLALITGHVADRFDRRRVLAVCYFVELSAMAVLAVQAAVGATQVWPIYLAVLMLGAGRAFEMPSGQALMPNLVPVAHFPNAVTWNSMTMQGASILGPALGGVLYIFGAAFVFGLCTLLLALALCAVAA